MRLPLPLLVAALRHLVFRWISFDAVCNSFDVSCGEAAAAAVAVVGFYVDWQPWYGALEFQMCERDAILQCLPMIMPEPRVPIIRNNFENIKVPHSKPWAHFAHTHTFCSNPSNCVHNFETQSDDFKWIVTIKTIILSIECLILIQKKHTKLQMIEIESFGNRR